MNPRHPQQSDTAVLRWPRSGTWTSKDNMPFGIRFQAVEYSNKQSIRENNPDRAGGTYAKIVLPLPKNENVNNEIGYSEGKTETGGLFDPSSAGMGQLFSTGLGITTLFKDITGMSAFAGQRPMDKRDQIFKGANFRTHSYSWKLIPKNAEDGELISKIVTKFQNFAYPMVSTNQQASRVIHPPIWHIRALNFMGDREDTNAMRIWDMEPLPSVLTSVKITTAGAAGDAAYAVGNKGKQYPAATELTVNYVELEPAINSGNGYLQSRSQIKGNARRGGD